MAKPTRKSDEDIQSIVKDAITSAKNFVQGEVEEERLRAMRLFKGEVPELGTPKDRSKVVATKCRDAVRSVKPVLMRVFLQSEKPAEYIPRGPDDVAGAEQATDYAQFKFDQSGGFQKIRDAFHDALVQKTGILKCYWDESESVDIDEYSNLTEDQVAMYLQGEGVKVLEGTQKEMAMPDGTPIMLYDMKVSRTKTTGELRVDTVPPEHFFVDEGATSCDDFYVIGHSEEKRVSDLVEMGFDFDEVSMLGVEGEEEAQHERQTFASEDDEGTDPAMKKVTLTEAYMRVDIEGTGVARLYKFICAGHQHKVLDHELADDVPFAIYEIDPEPHAFFGRSLIDLIEEDQNIATSLLRGLIDGVHIANNPKTAYREGQVDVEALLNNEYGALIAATDPQTDILEFSSPNSAATALPAMQYYDGVVDMKTGVSQAGMGMDSDALQAQTVVGANAMVQAAQSQIEMMARNLAEGGYARSFKVLFKLIRKHVPPGEHMRLGGQFVPVDPTGWNAEMDVQTNVGLGTGQKAERIAALQQHQMWQQTV
ncbi:MAG: hypothetical protein HRU30_14335, partial [Rhodobacteraceae bacterium]|nr:hypothetical protein [Paracoccaceae bacterium]